MINKRYYLVFFILVILLTVLLSSCGHTNSIEDHTTKYQDTNKEQEVKLPEYTVVDALLQASKSLRVTESKVICTVNLGISQSIIMDKKDVSIQTKAVDGLGFIEVIFKDKTGQSFSINLSATDYNKVIDWLSE